MSVFGHTPDLVARAPGRVNLIGEHTDYNEGFVLPAAISVETRVGLRARADGRLRVCANDFGGAVVEWPLEAGYAADPAQPWADYVRAMVCAMQAAGHALSGADLAISGTIPRGSGLSSSASLCVGVGAALAAAGGLACDATAIALLAQSAENDFVGMKCGIMDQLVSARGAAGHALLIDCRSLACHPVPVGEDLAIVIVHSGVVRGLVEGHYNQRRAACEAAAKALEVAALRDASLPMLARGWGRMEAETFARARHVISENARTLAAAAALEAGDLVELGRLMRESHASMRDDFAITTPEIDALAAELQALIGPEGGARMTGGGFGGAVVALCRAEAVAGVLAGLSYRTPAGEKPLVMIEQASPGAGLV